MAVQEIKQFKQQNGIDILKISCKTTKNFPECNNYFYCDAKDEDIVDNYTWRLNKRSMNIDVRTSVGTIYNIQRLLFHQELAYKYLGYYPDCIDHINGVDFDNTNNNLNEVTQRKNTYNRPSKNYNKSFEYNSFRARITVDCRVLYPYNSVHTEVEACQLAYQAETNYLRSILQDDYYMYDFLKDRRDDLDILDLERTGVVSSDEATYKHVIRYAKDNAWYYYRYNLAEYFKDNHIPVPSFRTDEGGFMRHPVTNELLCPFK